MTETFDKEVFLCLLQAYALLGSDFTIEEADWFKAAIFKYLGFDIPSVNDDGSSLENSSV